MRIKDILQSQEVLEDLTVSGWVRTKRDNKAFSFLELNDGSTLKNLQIIVDQGTPGDHHLPDITTGASVRIEGKLITSQGKGQTWELHATSLTLLGTAPSDYPLQKKGHSLEFLRSIAHLRPRTNLYSAHFRIRSRMAYAIHQYFQEHDFQYIHTPIVTSSDCEGAGELFQVTTSEIGKPYQSHQDFFARPTYLTVSGQLQGETFACALGNIYTFGPTFRAENSNTSRHAAEFWMIEPEMAFCDLDLNRETAQDMMQYLIRDALQHCQDDLDFLNRFVDKGLLERLHSIASTPFAHLTYTQAIDILTKAQSQGTTFEYPVTWGDNLQSEHERYLCEEHLGGPVTLTDYPATLKPFYMRRNDDHSTDRPTVAAMDLLVPGIGEIIGGSQREERLHFLEENLAAHDLPKETYQWYLDTRLYGTVPHSGFGLGFERLLMLITAASNIRDVIPFPRTPGHAPY